MTVFETAKRYLEAGLWAIPCASPTHQDQAKAGKAPLIKAWQSTSIPLAKFERILTRNPGANLGIVTGKVSGLVVLDVDPRNGGMRWFMENDHRLGNHLRETTGSGGIHLYYRYPAGREHVPSATGKDGLAPGIEVLADGGHQVVTWPSIHRSGEPYYFEQGLDLLDLDEADELPGWILDLLSAERPKPSAPRAAGNFLDTSQNVEIVREILLRLPAAVEGQGGDKTTFQAACIGRDYGLSPEANLTLLEEWNGRCRPPWSKKELAAKIGNAYKYGQNSVGSLAPENQFSDDPPAEPLSKEQADEQEQEFAEGRYSKKNIPKSARLFLSRREGKIKYRDGTLYAYNEEERLWQIIDEIRVGSDLFQDIETVTPRLLPVVKPGLIRDITTLLKFELDRERFQAPMESWLDGRHGDFVSVQNGILDIRQRELGAHTPAWFSFSCLPFSYDPEARCPEFEKFLDSIWDGDEDAKDCLRLWLGYLLLSETGEQKFAVFIGASRAGKGVLSRTIQRFLGKNACASPTLQSLAGEFGLAPLFGKRAAFFEDAFKAQSSVADVATERLISIVGRDAQMINRKYRDAVSVELPVKVTLVCNEFPAFANPSGALSNRMIVFPFPKTFAGKEDKKLEGRLAGETPGIFNWALEGARRLIEGESLRQPAMADTTFQEVRRRLEPILGFIEDMVEIQESNNPWDEPQVTVTALYEAYTKWCADNGHKPKAKNKFTAGFDLYTPDYVRRTRDKDGMRTIRIFTNVTLRPSDPSEFN